MFTLFYIGADPSTTKTKRPESVRERILRERKAKKISSKIVITPKSAKKSVAFNEGQREPLHVALRKSASGHGPRSVVANKIKQQAHFSAMKNYQVCKELLDKCERDNKIAPLQHKC